MNRREFLQVSAGLMLTAGLPAAETAQPWYGRPMRWAQLAFVEDDPGNYDQAFWLDYFRRIHADAACLSAGGCVAFYPTKIPLHHRSKWMKDNTDPFGDLVKGCRDLGMNVIARTDPHGIHQDAADAHPEWIMVTADGKPRRHWADPEYWVTCALGPYNFEFMPRVNDEIMSLYHVDGLFTNRWAGSGMCYCASCQKNFREFSGMALPRTANPQDPARRQYIVWHQKRLFELWHLWDSRIKAINPNSAYLANAGGGALSELDMKTIGELAPTLFADRQARRGLMPPWTNGKNGKEYRAALGRKPIAGIFSVGLEEPYRWKDSVQSGDEIRMWVMDGVAQDLRPWFTKFNAKPNDRRWLPVVEEIYQWHYRHEKYLRNQDSLARVGLVYSQQTATFYGGEKAHAKVEDHTLGFYQALIEARIPFDMVHDRMLDAAHISRYKTLVLPNIAALSTAQCDQLRDFVARGGSLVATHETSLYDEWGQRRADFGLASLFGASFAGRVEGPLQNSYLALGHPHPLCGGIRRRRPHHQWHEPSACEARGRCRRLATDGDSFLSGSPDGVGLRAAFLQPRCGRASVAEQGKAVSCTSRGTSIVRFGKCWTPIMANCFETPSCGRIMNRSRLRSKGRESLDLAIWTQDKSMTVHLVNLNNPMMMKGPVREIIPSPPQTVSVRIPHGRSVHQARLLVADKPVQVNQTGDRVEIEIPPIGVNEIVAIDF